MQTKKLTLESIQGKLSRNEMKNIMAGSGDSGSGTCCVHGTWAGGSYQEQCNISKESAIAAQQSWSQNGTFYWCCASC